ncbi:hypothetical protein EDWATA_03474 [Edwardsiella tarda ATCC 23685]|uniref:Uncharacterized protein n=1 Tax=Edwardsiella tarda ATCC 23685 TaxID=500638 RepID=D4F9L5_EDWTA|nr:hypothetical protein EDWATA_03474 [Edwardsiella tarda ATCC 23685]
METGFSLYSSGSIFSHYLYKCESLIVFLNLINIDNQWVGII